MNTGVLVISILSTSFLGSWHCAAMCGPIASLMAQRKSLATYHLGRFISYLSLGAVAGSFGQIFLSSSFVYLRWVAAGVLASLLVYLALTKIFPTHVKSLAQLNAIAALTNKLHHTAYAQARSSGWIFGLLTAFLPCGWLYTFVLAAMASGSFYGGVLVMGIFWLGGLPAMYTAPQLVKKLIGGTPARQQRLAGIVLLFSSFYSLWIFMWAPGR